MFCKVQWAFIQWIVFNIWLKLVPSKPTVIISSQGNWSGPTKFLVLILKANSTIKYSIIYSFVVHLFSYGSMRWDIPVVITLILCWPVCTWWPSTSVKKFRLDHTHPYPVSRIPYHTYPQYADDDVKTIQNRLISINFARNGKLFKIYGTFFKVPECCGWTGDEETINSNFKHILGCCCWGSMK